MLLLGCGAGGCEQLGALIYTTYGPLPVDAVYNLGDRPTLVIVEDAQHFGMNELDADVLSKDLTDDLTDNKITLVVADKLQRLRDTDIARYRSLSISDLARLTGASQVLYVDLENSTSGMDTSAAAAQGKATARVRVVNANTGATAWPPDERLGYPVSADMQFNQVDETRMVEQHAALLEKLSIGIGRMFHSYQPENDPGTPESQFDDSNQLDVKKDM